MSGAATIAVAAAIGALRTTTSSIGFLAARFRPSGFCSKEETRRGIQAVDRSTGTNMSVWKSFVGTPYQPTTSERVSRESMTASIQR